jgi:hypothetical protein
LHHVKRGARRGITVGRTVAGIAVKFGINAGIAVTTKRGSFITHVSFIMTGRSIAVVAIKSLVES